MSKAHRSHQEARIPKPLDLLQRNREHDARRRRDQPWRKWYHTARWYRLRSDQLTKQPLCERCLKAEIVTPATVCHHVEAHRGDEVKFWTGPFASSCAACHDIDEQRIERGGRARQVVGADGWPVGGPGGGSKV